jgi:hypothetical protein
VSDIAIIICVMLGVFAVAFTISAAIWHYYWRDYEKRQDEARRLKGRREP